MNGVLKRSSRAPSPGKPSGDKLRRGALQVLVVATLIVAWEFFGSIGSNAFFMSKPSLVGSALLTDLANGSLLRDFRVTMYETSVGFVMGAALGIVLGFALASLKGVAAVVKPFMYAIYGIPRIALAPLFIVWFGIGLSSKIYMSAMVAVFLTFVSTYGGILSVDRDLENIARVMGANELKVMWKVVLPHSSAWIISGFRVAFPQALVGAVVAEVIMSTAGLGHRIIESTQTFDMTGTMTGVVVLMAIVILINFSLDRLEGRLLRWRPPAAERGIGAAQGSGTG